MSEKLLTRLFAALSVAALFVAAAGIRTASADSPAPAASPVMVIIRNSLFYPSTVTVKVGTTVTWRNDDVQFSHTVTSTTNVFDSKNMDRGVVYSYTFKKPGKYPYTCTYHPYMQGMVIVTDENGNVPAASSGATGSPAPVGPPPPSPGGGY
jgi:plastocyanin